MMETYDLTPKQIKEIDEITLDKASAEMTLKVALNFHSNLVNKIAKQEKEWWSDMAEVYGLDRSKGWKVDFESPVICIREREDDYAKGGE